MDSTGFNDAEELRAELLKVRAGQIALMRNFEALSAEFSVQRSVLRAILKNQNAPLDDFDAKYAQLFEDEKKKALDRFERDVERIENADGVNEPPGDDPYWDRPQPE